MNFAEYLNWIHHSSAKTMNFHAKQERTPSAMVSPGSLAYWSGGQSIANRVRSNAISTRISYQPVDR